MVRTAWDDETGKWYFSVVDVLEALTDSTNPRNYWKVLKHRLIKEGNESVTNCNQLKLIASDGKRYNTDVADTEQLLRRNKRILMGSQKVQASRNVEEKQLMVLAR